MSYASRAYEKQNKKGEDYAAIPPVYLIGLMGVPIDHPDKEYWKDRYVSEYAFREKECHDLLDETIVIIFAELVNFNKTEDKRNKYNKTMQDEKRLRGQITAAREMGEAAGFERGREEGREEGGRSKALEIARTMLSMAIDAETIAKATGLSIEEIEKL